MSVTSLSISSKLLPKIGRISPVLHRQLRHIVSKSANDMALIVAHLIETNEKW